MTSAPVPAPPVTTPIFGPDALETGRLLCAGPVSFALGCAQLSQLPAGDRPEMAFAGRSNVGKSSLVNALLGRNKLARSSAEPGRTRELNYFDLGEGTAWLVDLPGYGYAKASKTDIARWTRLTRQFLRGRANLRRVFLLIDSRHGLKPTDLELMDMLDETAVTYQLILTKIDKLKKGEAEKVYNRTVKAIAKRPAAFPEIITTSSEKKTGIDMLRAEIETLALGN